MAELAALGETVSTVPGPSSVVGALVVSGLPTDRFSVEGFLPRKGGGRHRRLAALLMADERTTVLLEAPGRVPFAPLEEARGDRPRVARRRRTRADQAARGSVGRGTLAAAAAEFRATWVRGEVVLVVGGASPLYEPDENDLEAAVRDAVAVEPGAGVGHVADRVAAALGVSRSRADEATLRVRGARDGAADDGSEAP